MNRKRLVKKILALGSGLTMLGATIMGATAGLEAYPTQFVKDGVFTGKIVVGKNAATSDVLGAIDIAASLQAASTVDTPVEVPGAVGKTSFNGDALEWSLPNDLLGLSEPLGDVRQTVTDQELNSLKGGVITTDEGSSQYNQYLRFRTTGAQNYDRLQNGSSGSTQPSGSFVVFGKNDDPVQKVGDFLFFQEGTNVTQDAVFEYELEFQQGLQSTVKSRNSKLELRDLRDEVFNIFGQDFVFVDSTIKGTDTPSTSCDNSPTRAGNLCNVDVELSFLGGDVTDVLQEGETKTYTIDGIDYEVTAVFLANPNVGTQTAKFSVNGELTQELQAGETDTLSDGLQIGVQELLTNDRGGLVEFFLGANKIVFRDTNTRDTVTNGANLFNGFHNGVTIANEIIEDAWVQITGDFIDSDKDNVTEAGEKFQIQDIKYRLLADALTGTSNIYIAPGHGLREFLDEPAGMLNPNWDIRYEGFYDVGSTPIKIAARADDEYWLEFTNRQGNYYNIPLVEVSQSGTFRYGRDETRDFIMQEPLGLTANLTGIGGMNQSLSGNAGSNFDRSYWFPIGRKDTFILTNSIKNNGQDVGSASDPFDDTAFTHVLEYESIDTAISNQVVTFEDLALGPKEVKYTLGCTDCQSAGVSNFANAFILGQFQLVVGGNTFKGYIFNQSTGVKGGAYPLVMDLNGDGVIDGDRARITVKGGGIIDLGNNTGNVSAATGPGAISSICPQGGTVAGVSGSCAAITVNVTTLSRDFDEPNGGPESVEINVSRRATISQVTVNNVQYRRNHIFRTATTIPQFSLTRPDEVRDHLYAATDYGVLVDQYRPTSQTIPEEITLDYPNSMRGVQVYITAGKVQAMKTSGGGAFTTTQLNPIAVGLAVLDVDAGRMLGNTPLIVVGGPCANSVAAQLLGNPANCGQGFEPGKAMIKWFPDKMALLVAGYEAQETLGGSYVLADYMNPAYQMQGDEVEVVVADLNSITVKSVQ